MHRLPQIAAGSVLQRHWSRGAQPLAPDRTWLGLERAGGEAVQLQALLKMEGA